MLQKSLPRHYCPECNGHGTVLVDPESRTQFRIDCRACNGTGRKTEAQKRKDPAYAPKPKYQPRPSKSGVIDAPFIQAALKRKYGKAPWVYFSELRNAAAWDATRTIDGYAVHTGDTNAFLAFEIKITTADLKRDLDSRKWDEWTGMSTEFYFVTPSGMVDAAGIPDPAGLLEVDLYGNVRTIHRALSLPMFTVPASLVQVLCKRVGDSDET